ncbi:MAG TPA: GNAT family N-acetyltransferase [Solirubrobacteraceae bacterium]|jgi:predicted acetyltransferase
MTVSPLRLRPLRPDDEHEARAAHDELEADHFSFLLGWQRGDDWDAYVSSLARRRRGLDVPDGLVPASFLVADVDGVLVGRVSIRHELNEHLANVGGHIGYGVRPMCRGRGYATEMLRQALVIARAEGVGDVLVTCDEDNVASRTVIERLGGEFEDLRPEEGEPVKRRYWIR